MHNMQTSLGILLASSIGELYLLFYMQYTAIGKWWFPPTVFILIAAVLVSAIGSLFLVIEEKRNVK